MTVSLPERRALVLLISNKHVFGDSGHRIQLKFHKRGQSNTQPQLGETITITSKEFSGVYRGHPNPNIDLACLNISDVVSKHPINILGLKPEMLADFSEPDLQAGKDIWFVGYPQDRFDVANNLPILRHGNIASIPQVDFNSERNFLIDAQVFPGSSGSPVFTQIGDRYKLVGVVAQTMIRYGRVQPVPISSRLKAEGILGIGIVIKSPLVKELIDLARREVEDTIRASRTFVTKEPRVQTNPKSTG